MKTINTTHIVKTSHCMANEHRHTLHKPRAPSKNVRSRSHLVQAINPTWLTAKQSIFDGAYSGGWDIQTGLRASCPGWDSKSEAAQDFHGVNTAPEDAM